MRTWCICVPILLGAVSATVSAQCVEKIQSRNNEGTASFRFATRIALEGDVAVIGNRNATTGLPNSGSLQIYVFEEKRRGWDLGEFVPATAQENDVFGVSAALSGGEIFAGAPGRNSSRGSVLRIACVDGKWTELETLEPPEPASFVDRFGEAVALSPEYAAVGATGRLIGGRSVGGVFVYDRSNLEAPPAAIVPPDPTLRDGAEFGAVLALENDILVCSAPEEERVFVFRREAEGGEWAFLQELRPRGSSSGFGNALDLDGGILVVGGTPRGGTAPGSLDVYEFDGSAFARGVIPRPPSAGPTIKFGSSVQVDDGTIVTTGDRSLAWIFRRQANGDWMEVQQLPNPDDNPDLFASGVTAGIGDGVIVLSDDQRTFFYGDAAFGSVGFRNPDERTDVLFVNGSSGGADRRLDASVGEPISIELASAPAGPDPARYVLWVWSADSRSIFPLDLGTSRAGCTVNPTPFQPFASPQPIVCLQGGMPAAFCAGVRVRPAPDRVPFEITRSLGIGREADLILQGVIEDKDARGIDGFSVSNGLFLRVR